MTEIYFAAETLLALLKKFYLLYTKTIYCRLASS